MMGRHGGHEDVPSHGQWPLTVIELQAAITDLPKGFLMVLRWLPGEAVNLWLA
jgi:hypothetical protein